MVTIMFKYPQRPVDLRPPKAWTQDKPAKPSGVPWLEPNAEAPNRPAMTRSEHDSYLALSKGVKRA